MSELDIPWPRLPRWAGASWAALWGVGLLLPAAVGLGDAVHTGWCAAGLVAAFGLFVLATADAHARAGIRRTDRWPAVALLGVVCGALALDTGLAWSTLPILLAVAVGASTRLSWTPWLVVLAAAGGAAIEVGRGAAVTDAVWGTGLTAVLAGLLTCAFSWLASVIADLRATRRELARVAVSSERLRFSRDLHDLLGHGLSVISVKAQAARRTTATDPDAAAQHAADIELLAQQALADVRDAVRGYRQGDLDAEVARAVAALEGAGIATEVVRDDQDLSKQQRDLLAWVVREGATNVLRHARARHATIRTSSAGGTGTVVIEDDGPGPAGDDGSGGARLDDAGGTGLAGLRDRLGSGGRLHTRADADGYRLVVEVPARGEDRSCPPR